MGKDRQKPFGEFKTVNSILLTKYCSHRTEISTKDIVTLMLELVGMKGIRSLQDYPELKVVYVMDLHEKGVPVVNSNVGQRGDAMPPRANGKSDNKGGEDDTPTHPEELEG